jgi:uncharacterized protein involved in exopolysaccharide biosynthesis/Mrp family chromosome partitioning ATPase
MPAYRLPDAYAPQAGDGFGLAEFIAVIRNRIGLILKVTAAMVVAAVLFAYSLPTVWNSSATVMLEARRSAIPDAAAPAPIDPAALQNQIQILQSRELAGRVIEALELQNDPEFNGTQAAPGLAGLLSFSEPRGAQSRDELVDNFLQHTWAEPNGLSTSITVGAKSRDPQKAARIANALAGAYIEDQLASKQSNASQNTQWLDERAQSLQREVQMQNEQVQRYKARNGLTDPGSGASLNDQQMLAINTQIAQARYELEQKLAVQRSMVSGDPANTAQALASLTIQGLRAQQAELSRQEADFSTRYGPMHPQVVQLQARRRDTDQKIAQEIARISAAANVDVNAARSHLAALQADLAQAQGRSVGQNMARGELASMEANASSTRAAYEAFIGRLRNAQDQDAALTAEARLLSPAAVPQSPASPKRKLIVGASLPLGLMLGTLLALLLEKFGYLLRPKAKRRFGAAQGRPARRLPAAADYDGPPILGEIANAGSLTAADYVLDWPSSRFAHATVALVRQLESRGGEGAVLALTAPEPGDAKSVVAVSMARAAARMGKKVILIDCDPAHRTGTAMHTQASAGLYEVLTGTVPLHEALVKDPRSGAFLLSLNQRPSNAATMFASPQMARLMDILRDACDFVILDCGPALSGPDAALIARQADATLLVSRREKLQARSLMHATQALQNAKAAPVGVVLAS